MSRVDSPYAVRMKTKDEIVRDWLPRYTGLRLDEFGQYILLANFSNYVEMFAQRFGVEVRGRDKPMVSATAENITILSFGMDLPAPQRRGEARNERLCSS